MGMNIGNDVDRFKAIVKGKVRKDLKKFASSEAMTGQVGGKLVKIPLSSIDIPRFTFGSQNGGSGMGDGDAGDPMPGQGKGKGKGGKEAGEGEEEHSYIEFDRDELAQMIIEELELPDLEPKGKGSVSSEKAKYNKIGEQGVIKSYKRTYKEALKRSISSGIYSPTEPIVVPIRKDYRYKTSSTKPTPEISCCVFYLIDCSGSMGEEQRSLARKISFWIDIILGKTYKDIESVFIVHDSRAEITTRDKFFTISSGGGTQISSAYKLLADLMEKEYPFSDWNNYIIHMSDADNLSDQDNQLCGHLLNERILPNCNAFNFGETKSQGGSGDFARYLERDFGKNDKVNMSPIAGDDDILKTIKCFFAKGQ